MGIVIRWVIVLGFIAWCGKHGGITGAFYGFCAMGIFLFILYTMLDAWHKAQDVVKNARPNVTNQTLNVERMEVPARRGEAVSGDPTGPTVDDWGGIIESHRHRQKG